MDTSAVRVTAEGLVRAVSTTSGVSVIAELGVGPVRHADTAMVIVTNLSSPPLLASLSIHPVAPDSAIWSMTFPPILDNPVQGFSEAIIYFLSGLVPNGESDPQ